MAHYALLDDNNVVTSVFPGKDEGEDGIDWEQYYGEYNNRICKRTSYNTRRGVHSNGGTPFRKNYAGIGYTFDEVRDAFIPPKPFPSWILNELTCEWDPPQPYPSDFYTKTPRYIWNEILTQWDTPSE